MRVSAIRQRISRATCLIAWTHQQAPSLSAETRETISLRFHRACAGRHGSGQHTSAGEGLSLLCRDCPRPP
jgi:hypothetical protein